MNHSNNSLNGDSVVLWLWSWKGRSSVYLLSWPTIIMFTHATYQISSQFFQLELFSSFRGAQQQLLTMLALLLGSSMLLTSLFCTHQYSWGPALWSAGLVWEPLGTFPGRTNQPPPVARWQDPSIARLCEGNIYNFMLCKNAVATDTCRDDIVWELCFRIIPTQCLSLGHIAVPVRIHQQQMIQDVCHQHRGSVPIAM